MNAIIGNTLKVLTVMAALAAFTVLALAWLIYSTLTEPLIEFAIALGIPVAWAPRVVAILLTLLMPMLLATVVDLLCGRWLSESVTLTAMILVVVAGGVYAIARDWNFDSGGRSLTYLCPPATSDAKPRIGWSRFDNELGEACIPTTKANAKAIAALKRGVEPNEVHVRSVADLDALQTHRYGTAMIYADAAGRFFDGPGWERQSTELLRPVTNADLGAKRTHLLAAEADKKRIAAEAAEAEKKRLAEADVDKQIERDAIVIAMWERHPDDSWDDILARAKVIEATARSQQSNLATRAPVVEQKKTPQQEQVVATRPVNSKQRHVRPSRDRQVTKSYVQAWEDDSKVNADWRGHGTTSYGTNTYSNPTVTYIDTTSTPCVCRP